MKALSVKQPFAYLIVHGFKPIENRIWRTNYRGRLLIHASKTYSSYIPKDFQEFGFDYDFIKFLYSPEIPRGGFVGEVDLVDIVTDSDSQWFKGPYGLVLENPIAYEALIPYRGELGLFDVDLMNYEGVKV